MTCENLAVFNVHVDAFCCGLESGHEGEHEMVIKGYTDPPEEVRLSALIPTQTITVRWRAAKPEDNPEEFPD